MIWPSAACFDGQPGAYSLRGDIDDADVPATLQATIGARIDRLDAAAKRTLNAAAVIGSRFDAELLSSLVDDPDVAPLIAAELVDQVSFGSLPQYAFRHPLIRAVANESQLKSDRAQLHRRLASIIEQRDPGSADANAAMIAEHLEAAGELHAAFEWHMRAGSWVEQPRQQRGDDQLAPGAAGGRPTARRRSRSAGISHRAANSIVRNRIPVDRQRVLRRASMNSVTCVWPQAISDHSLLGCPDRSWKQYFNAHRREASALSDEQVRLLESINDPTLTLAC